MMPPARKARVTVAAAAVAAAVAAAGAATRSRRTSAPATTSPSGRRPRGISTPGRGAHPAAALELRFGLGQPDRGLPSPGPVRPGPGQDEEEDIEAEPDVPEYLMAEKRQPDRRRGGRGGRSGGYRSAIDRERYGVGSRSGYQRGPGRPRSLRPSSPGRASVHAMEPIEQTPGGDPWSEVPPEVQELLRAELARRQVSSGKPAPVSDTPRHAQAHTPGAPSRPSVTPEAPARRPSPSAPRAGAAPPRPAAPSRPCVTPEAPAEEAKPKRTTRRRSPAKASSAEPTVDVTPEAPAEEAKPKRTTRRREPRQGQQRRGGLGPRARPRRRPVTHEGLVPDTRSPRGQQRCRPCHPQRASAARPAHRRPARCGQDDAGARPRGWAALPARRSACASLSRLQGLPQGRGRQPSRPPPIEPEGAGEQIRIGQVQQLTSDLALTAMEGRFRVAVISAAHRLNPDAQNALLKTLEEPGPATCLVLCADDAAPLLPTVLSRPRALRLAALPIETLTELLVAEGHAASGTRPRAGHRGRRTARPGHHPRAADRRRCWPGRASLVSCSASAAPIGAPVSRQPRTSSPTPSCSMLACAGRSLLRSATPAPRAAPRRRAHHRGLA